MAERFTVGVRLARPIRERLELDPSAVSAAGTVRLGQPAVAREVAHRLGYADHAHLTREFRAVLGITPSRYRRWT